LVVIYDVHSHKKKFRHLISRTCISSRKCR